MTKPLYLMLSRTGTGMGSIIRLFTRNEYNHVSLSLDPELRRFVSFARYVKGVPLAGGFVEEPVERLLSDPGPLPVRIFRMDIPEEKAAQLENLFTLAGQRSTGLIYNTISALLTPMGLHLGVPGAYTCLEFASAVLDKRFRTLKALERYLEPMEILCGDLRNLIDDTGNREDDYFRRRGFWGGTRDTTTHFLRLFCRTIRLTRCPDPIGKL